MRKDALADAEFVLRAPQGDARALYDRAAPSYDRFRDLWLRLAGRSAEQALLDDLRAVLTPGARVLDAGAGTGALSRAALSMEPTAQVTLLDASPEMLAHAADITAEHVIGDVLSLPFADESFDIVVSGWVIETVTDPMRAVTEYLRVLKPDGHLFYTFCSLPGGFLSRAGTVWLRAAVKRGFAGQFLPPERTPWHDCERSHLLHSRGGLATEVALRKCCTVGDALMPRRVPVTHEPYDH